MQGFVCQNNDARDSYKPNLLKDDFDFSILSPRVCGKTDSPLGALLQCCPEQVGYSSGLAGLE
jgi:hypothetical protein